MTRERSTRRRAKGAGRRAGVAALTLLAVLGCAAPVGAEPPVGTESGEPASPLQPIWELKATNIAFDLIIVRPLHLGELIFGFVCVALPAAVAGRAAYDPWEHFVLEPFHATFIRPLGEFDEDF